jgi:ketosteroid isomerase-like protein
MAAVVLFGLSVATSALAADTGKIAAAIRADVDQLVVQFNAHDAVAAVSHDAPGIVIMFHGTPNGVGQAADLAVTKQQVADPMAKVTVSDVTVDVAASGDLAVYRATYAYTATDPKTKGPVVEHGNWLIGYRLQADGTWKIIWDIVSDT